MTKISFNDVVDLNFVKKYWDNKPVLLPTSVKNEINDYLINFENYRKESRGLYLYSPINGVGKSHAAFYIAEKLLYRKYRIRIFSAPNIVTLFSDSLFANKDNSYFEYIQSGDLILVDDMGKEFRPNKDEENNIATVAFDNFFRYCYQNNKPLIITSNITPSQISDRYSESVSSLLAELCKVVKFSGNDLRKER